MTYVVMQSRPAKDGKDRFVDVATCDAPEDAILVAGALFRAQPSRGDNIQVWSKHKRRIEYSLVCITPGDNAAEAERRLAEAMATCRPQEKKWRAAQRRKKAASNIRLAFYRRLDTAALRPGDKGPLADPSFCAAYFADPPRIEEATARAIELGFKLKD